LGQSSPGKNVTINRLDHTSIPQALICQVKANCELASSLQAGSYSLCGLLLRLRLLYKWEHGLPPWREPEPEAVLAWVADLESAWDARDGEPWQNLRVNGRSLDPFAVEEVNVHLKPAGLAYGAGFSRGLAPTFFLGELSEVRQVEEVTVLVLDQELARDLDGTPALCQGSLVYARRQALAYYLWDRLADPTQQANRCLEVALSPQGLSLVTLHQDAEAHQESWDELVSGELEAIIHHEIGEARETSLNTALPFILEHFSQTPLELWIRALKDALAEVNDWGRLTYLIKGRHLASLAFMLAFQPGFYPLLMPELQPAYQGLVSSGDWGGVDAARRSALTRLRQVAAEVTQLLEAQGDDSPERLRDILSARFLAPLGL
jgi:hypothetical protein